jgi:hypothetical protein
MPNKRLERTRHERASKLSCVGEPLKRNVRCYIYEVGSIFVMRKSSLALIAMLSFSGLYVHVIGQDKSSDDGHWPSLVSENKIIAFGGQPLFTIDERKLKSPSRIGNRLDLERCRSSETCQVYVTDFFSKWSGQDGIAKSVLRSDVLMHRYRYVGVNGHYPMTGTYVFFLPKRDVFYLWGDCAMNHFDLVLGPFGGDPRAVLKKLAEETSAK